MSCEGGVALNILGEGLGTGSAIQIEVIIHLEGTPAITSLGSITVSGASAYPGSTAAVESALNAASMNSPFKVLQTGLDFLKDNKGKSVKHMASGLADKALKHYAGFGLGDFRNAFGY
jgi:hypothetical protein